MRLVALALLTLVACRDGAPSAAEITDRAWRAHDVVVTAGERAPTCAEAGAAMQRAFAANRQAFVDALALDRDRARLREATAYIERHEQRYQDLETRMAALADRCADDPAVAAVFARMQTPEAPEPPEAAAAPEAPDPADAP